MDRSEGVSPSSSMAIPHFQNQQESMQESRLASETRPNDPFSAHSQAASPHEWSSHVGLADAFDPFSHQWPSDNLCSMECEETLPPTAMIETLYVEAISLLLERLTLSQACCLLRQSPSNLPYDSSCKISSQSAPSHSPKAGNMLKICNLDPGSRDDRRIRSPSALLPSMCAQVFTRG